MEFGSVAVHVDLDFSYDCFSCCTFSNIHFCHRLHYNTSNYSPTDCIEVVSKAHKCSGTLYINGKNVLYVLGFEID